MYSVTNDYSKQLLIIDTSPIRELVLFHAVNVLRFESLRPQIQCFTEKEAYQRCTDFIAPFGKKITSASVVAELHYWIRQTDSPGQKRLWTRVRDEFVNMDMDEEVIKLLDMDVNLLAKYGPVDTSLLELARLHSQLRPSVLTIDTALQKECQRAGFNSFHLAEIC